MTDHDTNTGGEMTEDVERQHLRDRIVVLEQEKADLLAKVTAYDRESGNGPRAKRRKLIEDALTLKRVYAGLTQMLDAAKVPNTTAPQDDKTQMLTVLDRVGVIIRANQILSVTAENLSKKVEALQPTAGKLVGADGKVLEVPR